MTVWIVTRFTGSRFEVDEVFDNEAAAIAHRKNLTNKWALTDLTQKEVKSL
jgi:hypothetical protein